MKAIKKVTSLIICIAFVLSFLPQTTMLASAAKIVRSGECGDNLTWTLDDEGTLTISGTGDMWKWHDGSVVPWYTYSRDSINKVIIEDGVTNICKYAFRSYDNLIDVVISDSVTRIDDYAFWGCDNIRTLTIPDGVITIGGSAISCCYKLSTLYIGENVKTITAYAFNGCHALTNIYYNGTKKSWNSIKIGDCNTEYLNKATFHFLKNNEETLTYAEDATDEMKKLADGSYEVAVEINKVNAEIDTVANDTLLSVEEAKVKIEKYKKDAKMKCGLLNLKFQITDGTSSSSEKSDIRFISTVDSLKDYKETGFYITINGIKKRIATKNVYSGLVGKNGAAITNYAPSDIFSESKYFSTYSIWNIPNSAFNTPITVQAFVLLKDGTEILGVEKTRKVSNFIK